MRLRGSSGTDEHQHYVDDGLQHKYEGLHQMRLALNRQDPRPRSARRWPRMRAASVRLGHLPILDAVKLWTFQRGFLLSRPTAASHLRGHR